MKKITLIITIVLLIFMTGCKDMDENKIEPDVDSITSASGENSYEQSSYDIATLKEKLTTNEFGNIAPAAAIATVNEDNTPNVAVFIPTIMIVDDKDYLVAWFSNDTHTLENLKAGRYGVYIFYEYDNSVETLENATDEEKTETKLERNKGCKVVLKYVGDDKQTEIYDTVGFPDNLKNNKLFLEIVDILPLG